MSLEDRKEWKTCMKKKPFSSLAEAEFFRVNNSLDDKEAVYHCEFCGKFHVGLFGETKEIKK